MRKTAIGCLLILLSSVGCGSSNIYPVSGKVVYEDGTDAVDVVAGVVEFNPVKDNPHGRQSARGEMNKDGTFELSGGALLGKHQVIVTQAGDIDRPPPRKIDPKYGRPETSDIFVEVEPKDNNFEIKVKRYKRGK